MTLDAYYARMWEHRQRDPIQGDFGKAWAIDNPSGFRAYMVMSRYDPRHTLHKVTDLYGRERWLNDNGWRVMCIALGMIAAGTHTTLHELAEKVGCVRQTASRWLLKLTAWGIIGSGIVRGRYGGVILWARRKGDDLERLAGIARTRLAAIAARRFKGTPPPAVGDTAVSGRRNGFSPLVASKGVPLDFTHENHLILGNLGVDGSRGQGSTKCPAHEDRSASLSWKLKGDRLLLHCFAGCTYVDIRKAVLG